MAANGGLITAEDLAQYKPKLRTPLYADYRGYQVVTMPPPSSGGTALIEILNFLKPFELGWNSTGHGSSTQVHLVTEAMKHAFSDRANYLGDSDFIQVPLDELTSMTHADKISSKI